VLRVVVGQKPSGIDPAEPGLGFKVGLPVFEALIVGVTLGGRHALPFDLVFPRGLVTTDRKSTPEISQHLPESTPPVGDAVARPVSPSFNWPVR
jgi:hypothetical protein